jgi:hypothetical protein
MGRLSPLTRCLWPSSSDSSPAVNGPCASRLAPSSDQHLTPAHSILRTLQRRLNETGWTDDLRSFARGASRRSPRLSCAPKKVYRQGRRARRRLAGSARHRDYAPSAECVGSSLVCESIPHNSSTATVPMDVKTELGRLVREWVEAVRRGPLWPSCRPTHRSRRTSNDLPPSPGASAACPTVHYARRLSPFACLESMRCTSESLIASARRTCAKRQDSRRE